MSVFEIVKVAVLDPFPVGVKVKVKFPEPNPATLETFKLVVKSAALGPDRVVPVMLRLAIPLFSIVMTLFAVFPIT